MSLILQKFIYRSDLRNNPTTIYIFGDNFQQEGLGGQAGEMRGEPNALGIATKRTPGHEEPDFFTGTVSEWDYMTEAFRKVESLLKTGRSVVFPEDGIGTGISELPIRVPTMDEWIKVRVKGLKEKYGG